MANTLATPSWVVKEVALYYQNSIKYVSNLLKVYDDQFRINGANVGNTIQVRLPQRFQPTYGQALQLQSLYDQTVPVTLTTQIQQAFGYSSAEATTEINDVRERYVMPAAETLANAVDVLAYQQTYKSVYSAVGTPGTTPNQNLTYLQAGAKLTDLAAPMSGRFAILDPVHMITLANANLTLFNPPAKISEEYETGQFGRDALGVEEWYQDQNRPLFTTGTWTSTATPIIAAAGQSGSTLNTSGWASGSTALVAGDIFTIAGVNSINPLSFQSTGRLQQFVVTANTSDSSGAIATLPISPSIITSGQLQTVDSVPANNAIINMIGSTGATYSYAATNSPQSLIFVKDFAAFVSADLVAPTAGARATFVRAKAYGFSLRMMEQYQIQTDQNPSRLDILCGAAPIQPRLACRIFG
jgi:hypothetical protein